MIHTLCHLNDIPLGDKKAFELGTHKLLVYRVESGVYSTESRCPHLFKSLIKGKVNDHLIECPMHKARFDIRTGEAANWAVFPKGIQLLNKIRPKKYLRTYDVFLEGDVIKLNVPKDMFI